MIIFRREIKAEAEEEAKAEEAEAKEEAEEEAKAEETEAKEEAKAEETEAKEEAKAEEAEAKDGPCSLVGRGFIIKQSSLITHHPSPIIHAHPESEICD